MEFQPYEDYFDEMNLDIRVTHNAGRPEAEFLTGDTITEIERISNTPFRNA